MSASLESILGSIPLFEGRHINIKRINDGLTNLNWTVTDTETQEKFFLKQHGAGTEAFINRTTALQAARTAARKGVGPQVFFHSHELGVEVHEFLENYRSCSVIDVQPLDVRDNIMRAYKSIHEGLSLEQTNTGFQQLADFRQRVVGKSKLLPSEIEHSLWQCDRAQARIEASGIDLKGCYNDSYISNYMMDNSSNIRIIDWEYAANNDPYWDIAMFCVESFFDNVRSVHDFIEMYDGFPDESLIARTYLYIGVVMVRWGLWAAYQQENSEVTFDFGQYSKLLLLRARRQMQESSWEWALSKA